MQEAILEQGFDSSPALTKWDQFAENERKFGIVLDRYNESEYTVPLDTNAPDFDDRRRRAEELASEIRNGRMCTVDAREARRAVDRESIHEEEQCEKPQDQKRGPFEWSGAETSSTDSNDDAVEEWELPDAPEYEPLPGGLAALPEDAKALLPQIAEHVAPSLRRLLEETGLVPRIASDDAAVDGAARLQDRESAGTVENSGARQQSRFSEKSEQAEERRGQGSRAASCGGQDEVWTGGGAAPSQRGRSVSERPVGQAWSRCDEQSMVHQGAANWAQEREADAKDVARRGLRGRTRPEGRGWPRQGPYDSDGGRRGQYVQNLVPEPPQPPPPPPAKASWASVVRGSGK